MPMSQLPSRGDLITALPNDVYDLLQTSSKGLSQEEAAARLATFGPNVVTRYEPYPLWRIALDQFTSPIIYVLLAAACITLLLGDYKDTVIILAVVVLNAILGFFQEYKATRAMEALRQMAVSTSQVRRGGQLLQLSSEELVPGDLVLVTTGMRVSADMRLVRSLEVLADESQLTGESEPVYKIAGSLADPETLLADTLNMVYAGSLVVEGRGEAIVFATGSRSELGKIAETVAEIKTSQTPLQRRLHRFANILAYGMVLLAAVTMVIGLLRGMELKEVFITAVALAVSVMPEGLPVVVTVVLSIGVRRMAARNVLVRKLPAAETMGSVEVICSDKTGTLTQNQMAVQTVAWGQYRVQIGPETPLVCPEVSTEGGDACPLDESQALPQLRRVLRVAVFCNSGEYVWDEAKGVSSAGSPTELALLEAAAVLAPELLHERLEAPSTAEVPFSSDRKFMATVQREGDRGMLYAKGAPEVIIPRCRQEWLPAEDREGPLEEERWLEIVKQMAQQGQRVVAVAQRLWDKTTVDAKEVTELTLVGLIGITDPPRPEAIKAIQGCKDSGIKVIMVTGDHPATAAAISQQVGLLEGELPDDLGQLSTLVNGAQLAKMSEEELERRAAGISAFARVTPHDKLRVVKALQRQEWVVAVTGDGVNDAPALRRADIGVAMGKTGTEAAREAADVVLLDDSFASIYEAVKLGRYMFENIRKVIFFLLSSGAGEVIAILGALALGWPLPFVAAQILWINLVTNGLQDIALAFEPGEEFVLRRPPQGHRAKIFDRIITVHTIVIGIVFGLGTLAIFAYVWLDTENLNLARTAAVTTMVMFQIVHSLNCRSLVTSLGRLAVLGNPYLLGSFVVSMGAQLLFVYWPPMQRLFSTEGLPPIYWAYIAVLSLLAVVAMELSKMMVRKEKWHLQ